MKKALIISGGWDGHRPAETSAIISADLKQEGFDVEISATTDVLGEARLKDFDLIIPNWTMGDITDAHEKALAQAIESGAGLGGFHGGMGDAFRGKTLYQFIVGGQFVAHPDDIKDYTVSIASKNDSLIAGLSDFAVNSEQYYMHVDPSNKVLATTIFQSKNAPWVNGTVMPVVWKRRFGQGRVFYQSIGHGPKEFGIPEVREITRRGLLWAAR